MQLLNILLQNSILLVTLEITRLFEESEWNRQAAAAQLFNKPPPPRPKPTYPSVPPSVTSVPAVSTAIPTSANHPLPSASSTLEKHHTMPYCSFWHHHTVPYWSVWHTTISSPKNQSHIKTVSSVSKVSLPCAPHRVRVLSPQSDPVSALSSHSDPLIVSSPELGPLSNPSPGSQSPVHVVFLYQSQVLLEFPPLLGP